MSSWLCGALNKKPVVVYNKWKMAVHEDIYFELELDDPVERTTRLKKVILESQVGVDHWNKKREALLQSYKLKDNSNYEIEYPNEDPPREKVDSFEWSKELSKLGINDDDDDDAGFDGGCSRTKRESIHYKVISTPSPSPSPSPRSSSSLDE